MNKKREIYFITGNLNKFNEIKNFIPNLKQIDIDLPEIQELDAKKIIEEKLRQASKIQKGNLFCEDVSLDIKCLNNFPGPLIKWFLNSLGEDKIWEIVKNFKDKSATAKSLIGYTDGEKIIFFEGETKGEIIEPKIKQGYGFDALFKPKGSNKAFSEMTSEIRDMRKQALLKLKNYIENGTA